MLEPTSHLQYCASASNPLQLEGLQSQSALALRPKKQRLFSYRYQLSQGLQPHRVLNIRNKAPAVSEQSQSLGMASNGRRVQVSGVYTAAQVCRAVLC